MDSEMIPDNTVTVVVKSKGKLYSKGFTLNTDLETDDDHLFQALDRTRSLHLLIRDVIFFQLGKRITEEVDPWFQHKRKSYFKKRDATRRSLRQQSLAHPARAQYVKSIKEKSNGS